MNINQLHALDAQINNAVNAELVKQMSPAQLESYCLSNGIEYIPVKNVYSFESMQPRTKGEM